MINEKQLKGVVEPFGLPFGNLPKNIPYLTKEGIPNTRSNEYMCAIIKTNQDYVTRITEKLEILISNKKLRNRMGAKSRKMVTAGKFSIKERNKKLKEVYDSII